MRYVLDASVAVASLRGREPRHRAAVEALGPLIRGEDEAVIPVLFRIEVASALARASFRPAEIDRFVGEFLLHAQLVTLGPKRAEAIQKLAVATKLRAADAVYAWIAAARGLPLLTCDAEIRDRAGNVCEIRTV